MHDHEPDHENTPTVFDLPMELSAKADPSMIAADERFFAELAATLEQSTAEISHRLAVTRRAAGRMGQEALERDLDVHRLSSRLAALRRFGPDACLGYVVGADAEPLYVGRLGLLDGSGRQVLVDWRTPAAEPFFGATRARPMGVVRRRRYRWTARRITDYWDEVFSFDGTEAHAALDEQSAFIASLGAHRSARMRDVLGTIAADQDAVIRAGSRGTLVVDGGPGTGKTVVALHRTAYLLYSDPRLERRRGGVLFVGPHQPYLAYVADVLPDLGEDGVHICTLRDLIPEGDAAAVEPDAEVALLKASADLVHAIDAAVAFYEQPPTTGTTVDTDWFDLWLSADDWAEAFDAPEPGAPHNESRETVWEMLITILLDKCADTDVPMDELRNALQHNIELREMLDRSWTLIDADDLVADLWSVPAYLRRCAPWLTADEARTLRRPVGRGWTTSDLPFLDTARRRLGDPRAAARARRRDAALAAEREQMSQVVDDLIASDESEMLVMSMLRGGDLRAALDDATALGEREFDPLAGPFAHIVVDEAQELTDAEWQMLVLRCPSRSFTVVGDRAQARLGFVESWRERLERVGLDRVEVATLDVNYRTPREVMAEAAPVIRSVLPDANVPTSIRGSGVPVTYGRSSDLDRILEDWLAQHANGIACVIGDPTHQSTPRVRSLTPQQCKGLEFDLVVLIDPDRFGTGIQGAVDRYVAMTRATGRLVILGDRSG